MADINYIEHWAKVLSQRSSVNLLLKYRYTVGEHELIKQKIAAKILQKSNLKTKDLEDKVKREIRFSKYFRHPNIIRLYEVIETNSEIILIMEYAQGGELYDLICRGKVNTLLNLAKRKRRKENIPTNHPRIGIPPHSSSSTSRLKAREHFTR